MKVFLSVILILPITLSIISCDDNPIEEDEYDYDRVLFSEIYLNNVDRVKSWIELYNPTDESITINGGRYSHIRILNHIPTFTVPSKSYLVICASDSAFKTHYNNEIETFEIITLTMFDPHGGGFFAIWTRKDSVNISSVFKYGSGDTTEFLIGSEDAPFSNSDSTYSAEVVGINEVTNLYEFTRTNPTPGQPNNY